ncbi:zinc/manganese transport system ATP-binding protein [Mycobacterium sp. MAA66]|uniref:metal ABC transporter ATP-binding protein n=1 Tax=Mycobacterium sp. MAA66 TaxID=3156297 RepID=UPI0035181E06
MTGTIPRHPGRVDPTDPTTAAVCMRNAAAVVGGRTVWSQVSLDIMPEDFVAILGPNGSGKSTLIKSLLGLNPVSGTVEVLGAQPGRRNSQIGYVPQRRAFDSSLRIRGIDVVALGLDGTRWGTPIPLISKLFRPQHHAERKRRIDDAVATVGAAGYAHRPIGRCSGGEQQRLLIAQALLRDPRLLLLDEPLDSLDVPSQSGISALVRDICRRNGVAVVMVAHDVNPILPYLDRVIYLAGGHAASGTPQEVITADQLTALYGVPIDVLHDRTGRMIVVGQPE